MGNFKQKEDLKMHIQLTDYDNSQGYDLGMGEFLSQVAQEIYANFHKPSWETWKHHFYGKNPKENF